MRISVLLAASLIGCAAASLPASASDFEELRRAWTDCTSQHAATDKRIIDCSKVIASTRTRDEHRAQAFTARGFARLQKGDRDGGWADFEESIRIHPTATAYAYRGSMLISRNEFALALALADFTRAIELDPNNAEHRRMRAFVHSQLKDPAATAKDLTTAIELNVNPKRDYLLRGIAYEEAGDKQKAVADYERALEADPDNQLMRRSVHALGGTIPASAQLPPGDCSANDISNETRAAACADAIASGKLTGWTLRTAYCNRGTALTDIGQYDVTIAESDKLIGLDPNAACGYLNRGRALFHKNEVDRAIADYNQTIKLDPMFHEAYANRGTAHHSRGDYARAIADYDIAIRQEPDVAMYHSDRGNSRYLMRDYNRAIADLSRAIELEPDNVKTFLRRGDAFLETREFARAEADFDRALELAPGNMHARNGRAQAHAQQGKGEGSHTDTTQRSSTDFDRFRRNLQ